MKGGADKVNGGSVTQPIYDIWMSDTVESNSLVLKIRNQRSFELGIGLILQKNIESFYDDCSRSTIVCVQVIGDVDFRIATTAKTFDDVIPSIESALLKF